MVALQQCPKDIRRHRRHEKKDLTTIYFVLTVMIILVTYLHLVGLAQQSSFQSYQAGYEQGVADTIEEVRNGSQ